MAGAHETPRVPVAIERFWDRLSSEKARAFKALLSGEDRSGVLLRGDLGECAARLEKAAEGQKRRGFRMTAYTGKRVVRWWGDMVIELSGIEREERTPMLLEHVDSWPVAVAEKHGVDTEGFGLEGYMLSNSENAEARKLIANIDEGVPYKASIGIRFLEQSEVAADADVEVNGETHRGPLTVIRRARLFETSFLLNPADLDTTVEVMSASQGRRSMPFNKEQLLKEHPELFKQLQEEAVAKELERAAKLSEAFPGRPKFVAKMLSAGHTVEQAKLLDYDRTRRKLEDVAKALHESKQGQETVKTLREQTRASGMGLGFDPKAREQGDRFAGMSIDERCKAELAQDVTLREIFERFEGRGGAKLDPQALYRATFHYEQKRRADMRPYFSAENMERAAAVLREHADPRFGPLNFERFFAAGDARLGAFKGGPDYSVITAKGFLGLFYPRFEDEISGLWSKKIAFQSESNQETEIHRWLGMFPQMTLWTNERRTDAMPTYQQLITNLLYQAAVEIDKNDYRWQKFGIISQRLGEAGSVAAEHWNQLATTVVEANGTCYDSSLMYSSTHALGGQAPATQQNAFTGADDGAFRPADPNEPTVQEAVAIILALIGPMYGFKFSNNQPANGGARQFEIVVPFRMGPNFNAATQVDRLNFGQDNPLKKQPFSVEVSINPRATQATVVRAFRKDCMNRALIMQEPGAPEVLFQGPGSYLEWFKHTYGYAIESTRAVGLGDWLSTTQGTCGG